MGTNLVLVREAENRAQLAADIVTGPTPFSAVTPSQVTSKDPDLSQCSLGAEITVVEKSGFANRLYHTQSPRVWKRNPHALKITQLLRLEVPIQE